MHLLATTLHHHVLGESIDMIFVIICLPPPTVYSAEPEVKLTLQRAYYGAWLVGI